MNDEIEQKRRLFDYWDEIPFLVDITLEEAILVEDPVRLFIFRYLRDGVEDKYPTSDNEKKRRHAFSIKELHKAYIDKFGESHNVSVQNFHHHVNILKEMGLLFEVEKILEGRHYVRYFGRVAKVLDNPFDQNILRFRERNVINPLKNLIQNLNPGKEYKEIDELLNKFHIQLSEYQRRVYRWIMVNYDAFYDSKLDLQQFLFLSPQFAQFTTELDKTRLEITELLGFDNIDDYLPITRETVLERGHQIKNTTKGEKNE